MKPSGYNVHPFAQNTSGLKNRQALASSDPNSSSDLLNIDLDKTGGIRSRRGYTRVANSPLSETNCLGLADYKIKAGSLFAVGVFDDAIYKMDSYDGTWDVITGSVSLSAGYYTDFATGQDTLIGTNGVDAPWKFTGTGNAAALSISQFTYAKYVEYYYNRLIFANTTESATTYPSRVRWGNVGTIETYTATDYTDEAQTNDSSEIVGMIKLYDDLYIFKNSAHSGIKKLYYTGNADVPFVITNIGEVGAISGRSLVHVDIPGVGNGILYWGVDNQIRFFDGNISVVLSQDIQPTLDVLSTSRLKYIQGANYTELNQVWFTCSNGSSTTHNRIIVYDYLNKAFLVHDNINANVLTILSDTDDNKYLISGGYNGLIFQHNVGNNDDGSGFDKHYWTAWLDLGNPTVVKKVRWLQFYAAETGNYDITVDYNYDFMDGVLNNNSINLATGDAVFPFTFPITLGGINVVAKTLEVKGTGRNRFIRFRYRNVNADEPFTIYRFDVISKQFGIKDLT